MRDRLDPCYRLLGTWSVISGELSERPFEGLLGEVNLQFKYHFGARRYVDIEREKWTKVIVTAKITAD